MTRAPTIAGFAALGVAVAVAAAAQAQDSVGVNAAIRNSIRTQPTGETALRPAALRAPVRTGDLIVSGPASQLQVLLRDQTVFTVGANARVTIDRFVFDANRSAAGASASVARGAFRFVSGRGGAHGGGIQTPVASIGVRGTIVEGVVGPDALAVLQGQPGMPPFTGAADTASLIVLRGPGPRWAGLDTPGAIDVTVGSSTRTADRPGQALLASSTGLFGPFDLSDEASRLLSALLRPAPSSNTDSGPGDVVSAALESGDAASFGDGGPSLSPAQVVEPRSCEGSRGGQSAGSQQPSSCGDGRPKGRI